MRTLRRSRPGKRGVILVWTLFVAFLIGASTFVTTSLSSTMMKTTELESKRAVGEAICHAALEQAEAEIAASMRINAAPPASSTYTLGDHTATFTIAETTPSEIVERSDGLQVEYVGFRIESHAVVDGVDVRMRRVVRSASVPIFQFAIFYENDLEFFNPAPWEITGRVHCNSDIYIRFWTSMTFNTNYLRAAGDLYGRAPFSSWYAFTGAAPMIRRWVADPFDNSVAANYEPLPTIEDMSGAGLTTRGGLDSDFAGYDANSDGDFDDAGEFGTFLSETLRRFGPTGGGGQSTLQTGEHGVGRLDPPTVDELAMFKAASGGDYTFDSATGAYAYVGAGAGTHQKNAYAAEAGLTIESFDNGTWKAYDSAGFDVTSTISAAITSSQIFDRRQSNGYGQRLTQIEVDMAALAASGAFPSNGLIYMVGNDAGDGSDVRAFTVKNGSELPNSTSIVSPNSVYLQGDYNTTDPKPAAVIADAVNLLSNAWTNAKNAGSLPLATETTYNVSVIAGDVESTEAVEGGGPHNLLRRHEDWSSVPERVTGSIVCPFRSKYATGDFKVGDDYYQPPDRYWSFDHRNLDATQRPPFTPVSIEIEDLSTWIPRP